MAKDYKREDILYPDQKIIQSELVHEMYIWKAFLF